MYTVWGRPNCPWCDRAKEHLEDHDIQYNYIELTAENLDEFNSITNGARTVPQVFDNVGIIGGYEDLIKYLKLN